MRISNHENFYSTARSIERYVVGFVLIGCYFISFFYNFLLLVFMQEVFFYVFNSRIFGDSGDWNDSTLFTVPKYLFYKV